jgi:uncharacterized protein
MFRITRILFAIFFGGVAMACSSPETEQTATATSDQTELTETTVAHPTTTMSSMTTTSTSAPARQILVFHKTAEFRHDSIEPAIQTLQELADGLQLEVTATEDAAVFTPESLESFDVVVFLNTTGDVLDESQQTAMEQFIQAGRGFVGIHSAADTEYEWEWYGGLTGAFFDSHPEPQEAIVDIVEPEHPAVADLPEQFERYDEWYNFQSLPDTNVTILATVDESTYEGGNMGEPHPIVWAREYDGGRAVYIGFGHTSETFSEPLIRTLLSNSIAWTAYQEP